MKLTYSQYRLLVRLSSGPVWVRPTNLPGRKLVQLGLAVYEQKQYRLHITKAGVARI